MNLSKRYLAFVLLAMGWLSSPSVVAQPAPAATPAPVYAMLSLIGDRLDTVVRRPQTGSLVDNNLRTTLAITDPVFDDAAIAAAAHAIRRLQPGAEFAAINTRSPVLFEQQRTLFEVSEGVLRMPDAIRTVIREQGASRLVLVGKLRDEPQFTFQNGIIEGVGKLEGLGFYLDGTINTTQYGGASDPSLGGRGFIAPYAMLQISLVDFPSGRVLGRRNIKASRLFSAGRAQDSTDDPWSALSSAEKARSIKHLIEDEVDKAMTALMAR